MSIKDFFKKKEEGLDPLKDLVLSKLKVGYLVDYDLKTWQVTGYSLYDYGEGYKSDEWELTESSGKKFYLERSDDDEIEWSLSKKIPIGSIEGNIRKHIIDNDDPPDEIKSKERNYYLDESGSGEMYETEKGEPNEFVYWDFIDKEDEHFLTVQQWNEKEFEASEGFYVEEYQFSNILPGDSS